MEKTIWTPDLHGRFNFDIYLDRDFATDMIRSKISNEKQTRFNALANEELEKLAIYWLNPYAFHEDSCFIKEFYLGQNGVTLFTDHHTIADLVNGKESSKPIKYHSEHAETRKQAYTLMTLFDEWVKHADALKSD